MHRIQISAIQNLTPSGLIALIGANFTGGEDSATISAIQNNGLLYARNVTTSGFQSAIHNSGIPVAGTSQTEYDSGPTFTLFDGRSSSLRLPIQEIPGFEEKNLKQWKSVAAYGAVPTGVTDSSTGIQAAIDSGCTTVYFPAGIYKVTKTIVV